MSGHAAEGGRVPGHMSARGIRLAGVGGHGHGCRHGRLLRSLGASVRGSRIRAQCGRVSAISLLPLKMTPPMMTERDHPGPRPKRIRDFSTWAPHALRQERSGQSGGSGTGRDPGPGAGAVPRPAGARVRRYLVRTAIAGRVALDPACRGRAPDLQGRGLRTSLSSSLRAPPNLWITRSDMAHICVLVCLPTFRPYGSGPPIEYDQPLSTEQPQPAPHRSAGGSSREATGVFSREPGRVAVLDPGTGNGAALAVRAAQSGGTGCRLPDQSPGRPPRRRPGVVLPGFRGSEDILEYAVQSALRSSSCGSARWGSGDRQPGCRDSDPTEVKGRVPNNHRAGNRDPQHRVHRRKRICPARGSQDGGAGSRCPAHLWSGRAAWLPRQTSPAPCPPRPVGGLLEALSNN